MPVQSFPRMLSRYWVSIESHHHLSMPVQSFSRMLSRYCVSIESNLVVFGLTIICLCLCSHFPECLAHIVRLLSQLIVSHHHLSMPVHCVQSLPRMLSRYWVSIESINNLWIHYHLSMPEQSFSRMLSTYCVSIESNDSFWSHHHLSMPVQSFPRMLSS